MIGIYFSGTGNSKYAAELFCKEYENEALTYSIEAHSCYFSKDAYADMVKDSKYADNKELMIIPGASHTDLYDQMDIIPFDKIQSFFEEYLK